MGEFDREKSTTKFVTQSNLEIGCKITAFNCNYAMDSSILTLLANMLGANGQDLCDGSEVDKMTAVDGEPTSGSCAHEE